AGTAASGEGLGRWAAAPIKGALAGLLGGSHHPGQNGAPAVAFSPAGKLLAAGTGLSKATLHVWDASAGKELRGFATGQPFLSALAFSPDGNLLLPPSPDPHG